MQNRTQHTPLCIVGAGPLGLELAVALKTRGVEYTHFEAGQIGSTIGWYAPGTQFFSSPERIQIAGVPLETANQQKATREDYLRYLRSVVRQFDLKIETNTRVISASKDGDNFRLTLCPSEYGVGGKEDEAYELEQSQTFELVAEKVVLATGDMHRAKKLAVPGEDLRHVSHYLTEPHAYFRKKVLIVGGKNSAVEAAIRLYRVGAGVSISYRQASFDEKRVKYWLYPEINGLIRKNLIQFFPESEVKEIRDRSVVLNSKHGQQEVEVESVVLLTGYEQDSSLFESFGISLKGAGKKPSFNLKTYESNVAGVYVCGNCSAGTQLGGVREFIETGHAHIPKILASLMGEEPPTKAEIESWMPET